VAAIDNGTPNAPGRLNARADSLGNQIHNDRKIWLPRSPADGNIVGGVVAHGGILASA